METEREALLERIEKLRETLQAKFEELGKITGEILELSRKLDELVVEYQKRFRSRPSGSNGGE